MKKYQIILADPPWKYNSRANHKTRFRGGCCGHYSLMSMDEIKALPIDKLADDNCVLFLWTTFPYLEDQIKLFNHWGFIDGIGWYVRKNDLKRMVVAYEDVFTFHPEELKRFQKQLKEVMAK